MKVLKTALAFCLMAFLFEMTVLPITNANAKKSTVRKLIGYISEGGKLYPVCESGGSGCPF